MNSLGQDLGYRLRMLRKSPGSTILAITTLALAIGANAAIFGFAHETWLWPPSAVPWPL